MISNSIALVLNEVWPMIFICLVIVITLRLGYIIKNKVNVKLYKELISLIFIVYFLCLFYIVTYQDVSWSGSNFTLFKEISRYELGTQLFVKNIIGNILLFIPYGLAIGYYIDLKKIRHAILLGLLVSCSIETMQYLIGRVFDVDDILLNVLGCAIGFIIYLIFDKIREKLPKLFRTELFYNIFTIIVLIIIFVYLLTIFGVIVW